MDNFEMFTVNLPESQPSKVQLLTGIITEKLAVAVREIMVAVEATIVGYDKEILSLKRELEDCKSQMNKSQQPIVSLTIKEEHCDDNYDGADDAKPTLMQESENDVMGAESFNHSTSLPSLIDTDGPEYNEISRQTLFPVEEQSLNGAGFDQLWSTMPELPQEQTIQPFLSDSYQNHQTAAMHVVEETEPELIAEQNTSCESGSEPQCCKVCGVSFTSLPFLIKHILHHHLDNASDDYCVCGVCGQPLEASEDIKTHLETHIKLFRCEKCDRCFVRRLTFQKHICEAGQSSPAEGTLSKMSFQCDLCPQSFKYKTQFQIHYRRHTGEKADIYEKPLTTFNNNIDDKQSNMLFVKCPLCDKVTNNMAQHMMIHSGEKPFSCTECGMKFHQRFLLNNHMNSHLGVKRFSCTECSYRCTRKQHLVVHMRTHTGQKPYRCGLCDKAFTQNHNLKSHMKRYHRVGQGDVTINLEA